MPRPSNTLERRAQIVDGLMTVLPQTGYERASVAAIARAAGLSPGLVHYHFQNKQEILLALGETLVDAIDARITSRATARLSLHAFVDAHLALGAGASARSVACWVALGAEAVFQEEVGDLYRRLLTRRRDRLVALLREVCREEGRSAHNLSTLAATVLAATEGYYQLSVAAPGLVPRGSAASSLRTTLDHLLDAR